MKSIVRIHKQLFPVSLFPCLGFDQVSSIPHVIFSCSYTFSLSYLYFLVRIPFLLYSTYPSESSLSPPKWSFLLSLDVHLLAHYLLYLFLTILFLILLFFMFLLSHTIQLIYLCLFVTIPRMFVCRDHVNDNHYSRITLLIFSRSISFGDDVSYKKLPIPTSSFHFYLISSYGRL